ncbi:hypothetical protein SBA3_1330059 [Candidatus Sulfopaludibacter sp. SbA3]|nr:hypothetical protein SBA3_1330059 [Candidatus Sulfopaludibacter sp. SbA3]
MDTFIVAHAARWDRRSFCVVCQSGATAPQYGLKNRRLVAPAVSPPVALADRRQDRRRYPVAGPVFRPC